MIKVFKYWNDAEVVERRVNAFERDNLVFATQSHVVVRGEDVCYVFVVFYRPKLKDVKGVKNG